MVELFSAFGIDWRLLIVQSLNFLILLGVLWYFLYKPLLTLLKKREETIAQGVADAEAAEKARGEIEVTRHEKLKEAEVEASEILSHAKKAPTEEKTRIVTEAESRAESVLTDAQARGEELATQAKKDAEKEIARMAVLAAEKVLAQKK